MQGKNILVTGASSGMGEAMTRHFYKEGATVIAVARNGQKLQTLKEELGSRLWVCPADLSIPENVRTIFGFCKENGLKLDGIVHSAGVTMNCPLRSNRIESMEQLMRVNFEALVEICHYASNKSYAKEGAAIVAISSTAGLRGGKGVAVYSASKAAVNNLVKSAAMELLPRKIRINAIAPTMVRTKMYYDTVEEIPNIEEMVNAAQPLGLIEPESIAEVAHFLLSEKARYITGSILTVGAGDVF